MKKKKRLEASKVLNRKQGQQQLSLFWLLITFSLQILNNPRQELFPYGIIIIPYKMGIILDEDPFLERGALIVSFVLLIQIIINNKLNI